MNWLDHSRTFREQGVEESETLLLRRKFFYSDQNVDSRDPVQLNLLYVQVTVLARWSEEKHRGRGAPPTVLSCNRLVYGLACNHEGVQSEAEGSARGFNDGAENRQW